MSPYLHTNKWMDMSVDKGDGPHNLLHSLHA